MCMIRKKKKSNSDFVGLVHKDFHVTYPKGLSQFDDLEMVLVAQVSQKLKNWARQGTRNDSA